MRILTVRHITTYRYRQPVLFGEHRLMLRPREGQLQHLLDGALTVTPEPASLRWTRDLYGNSVALVTFAGRASELSFDSRLRLEHEPSTPAATLIEARARLYPFAYDGEDELPDLAPLLVTPPDAEVAAFLQRFRRADGKPQPVLELLSDITHFLHRQFGYERRTEHGTQAPAQTLALRRGTCRDFAVLMLAAVRALGLAARFASGYIHVGGRSFAEQRGGGSTHAWVEVYLPGAGWVDFDPTNGIVGNRDLIPVAVGRTPSQVVPIAGSYTGFASDDLGMTVTVRVGTDGEPQDNDTIAEAKAGTRRGTGR